MMRAFMFGLAVACTTSQIASAQEPIDFLGSDRETAAELSRIVETARTRGLPTEPIVAKAKYAVLVHTPPARIVAAAQAVSKRLEVARDALGPSASKNDLAASENALSTPGVTGEMIQLVRQAQTNRAAAVPIGVMAQLVASGVKPAQAAEIVTRLVRGNATDKQLAELGNAVNQDVAAGAGAMQALEIRLQTLKPVLAHIATPNASQGITNTTGDPRPPGGKPRP